MRKIIPGINKLSTEELRRANRKNPLFHSEHEALGVIGEELHGAEIEMKNIHEYFEAFKTGVYNDCNNVAMVCAMRKYAVMCACELIQVIAMCDKAIMSKEARNE